MGMSEKITITYIKDGKTTLLEVSKGCNLRRALINAGLSPYTEYTEKLNCGGMGICATCGVWVHEPAPEPVHWHDKIAKSHGYPRLSCQIHVNEPLTVEEVKDKKLWGLRAMKHRKKEEELRKNMQKEEEVLKNTKTRPRFDI